MPTYEYRCLNCKRRFELFMNYADYAQANITCPHCQSDNVQRRIGRIRVARSDESRLQSMATPEALDSLDEDPRALGKMMREMSGQMGEEMPSEFHEVVNRLEKGQSPEEIERDLPNLGGMGADDAPMGGDFED